MRSLQTYTPRVRRLTYDALRNDVGCQPISGVDYLGAKAFTQACIAAGDMGGIFSQTDSVSYAIGPFLIGTNPPWFTPWAAWISTQGIRVGRYPSITPPAPTLGAQSSLLPFTNPLPTKASLGFTSIGQMGIAIEKSGQTIQVKWFTDANASVGSVTFSGYSPVMFGLAGISAVDTALGAPLGDLVLYYLRSSSPKTIFARFESEGFDTEHVINDDLPVSLSKLIAVERVGNHAELYALDSLVRDVTFSSPDYGIAITHDKATLSTSIASGSYGATAIGITINSGNKQKLAVSVASGSYSAVIVNAGTLSGDKASVTVEIDSGYYQ